MWRKKTKIVATLGPSTDGKIKEMLEAGLNVVRVNFSHADYGEVERRLAEVDKAAAELGVFVGKIADIQGPKIRTGKMPKGVHLRKGQSFTLTTVPGPGSSERVYVGYPYLTRDLKPNNTVYLDDANLELVVEEVTETEVRCRVVIGGELVSHKGVSLPGVKVELPAITEKDVQDIKFAVEHDFDFIAASFVRHASHLKEIRQVVQEAGGNVPLIAKVENEEGLANLDEIIKEADAVMIARGDLGVSLPPHEIPLVQKRMIKRSNSLGKPVITATQMLDSMRHSPRPTRAEVTDVANAILDGTDAVMLSGETAVGEFPVQAIKMMSQIAIHTEQSIDYSNLLRKQKTIFRTVADAISHATCQTAEDLAAKAIITSTESGTTARLVASYRPKAPIVAATPNPRVAKQLTLSWGVSPVLVPRTSDIDSMIEVTIRAAEEQGFVQKGDTVVMTAGLRPGIAGSTNLLKVHII
ncbi:MAG: pyruvate kinase [Firmicutes bacterium]|nr:pyruvate kinase [Bacillota bacterium]